jgi:hypothetical protein
MDTDDLEVVVEDDDDGCGRACGDDSQGTKRGTKRYKPSHSSDKDEDDDDDAGESGDEGSGDDDADGDDGDDGDEDGDDGDDGDRDSDGDPYATDDDDDDGMPFSAEVDACLASIADKDTLRTLKTLMRNKDVDWSARRFDLLQRARPILPEALATAILQGAIIRNAQHVVAALLQPQPTDGFPALQLGEKALGAAIGGENASIMEQALQRITLTPDLVVRLIADTALCRPSMSILLGGVRRQGVRIPGTVLQKHIAYGDWSAVQLLKSGLLVFGPGEWEKTLVSLCLWCSPETAGLMLTLGPATADTSLALIAAVASGTYETVDLLLKDGRADPTAIGHAALCMAAVDRAHFEPNVLASLLASGRVNPMACASFIQTARELKVLLDIAGPGLDILEVDVLTTTLAARGVAPGVLWDLLSYPRMRPEVLGGAIDIEAGHLLGHHPRAPMVCLVTGAVRRGDVAAVAAHLGAASPCHLTPRRRGEIVRWTMRQHSGDIRPPNLLESLALLLVDPLLAAISDDDGSGSDGDDDDDPVRDILVYALLVCKDPGVEVVRLVLASPVCDVHLDSRRGPKAAVGALRAAITSGSDEALGVLLADHAGRFNPGLDPRGLLMWATSKGTLEAVGMLVGDARVTLTCEDLGRALLLALRRDSVSIFGALLGHPKACPSVELWEEAAYSPTNKRPFFELMLGHPWAKTGAGPYPRPGSHWWFSELQVHDNLSGLLSENPRMQNPVEALRMIAERGARKWRNDKDLAKAILGSGRVSVPEAHSVLKFCGANTRLARRLLMHGL